MHLLNHNQPWYFAVNMVIYPMCAERTEIKPAEKTEKTDMDTANMDIALALGTPA